MGFGKNHIKERCKDEFQGTFESKLVLSVILPCLLRKSYKKSTDERSVRDFWVCGPVSGRGHPGHQDTVNENESLETVRFVPKGYGNNRQTASSMRPWGLCSTGGTCSGTQISFYPFY